MIKKAVEKKWRAPSYYFHLQKGGHVAAVRSHLGHSQFAHLDIQDFFGSVTRTKLTRSLRKLFGYKLAREWAIESTVYHPRNKKKSIVPYGFVQSQILSSIALRDSALGRLLHRLSTSGTCAVSVYVDDLIISSDNAELTASLVDELVSAASRARFTLVHSGPAVEIGAFNILLSQTVAKISPERIDAFLDVLGSGPSESRKRGILAYVASVCPDQVELLA
jgi:hypothetical protein